MMNIRYKSDPFSKAFFSFQKTKQFTLWCIVKTNENVCLNKILFMEELFAIVKKSKQLKYPSAHNR